MRLLGSCLAVRFEEPPETQDGFFISVASQNALMPQVGVVHAVGPVDAHEKMGDAYEPPRGRSLPFPKLGNEVYVNRDDGSKIEGTGEGHEIRIYGIFTEYEGSPQRCAWWSSVLAEKENGMWKATGDNILVEPDQLADRQGVILLPDVMKRSNAMGTVRSVGPLVQGLKVGDRVCYSDYAADSANIDLDGCVPMAMDAVLYVEDLIAA